MPQIEFFTDFDAAQKYIGEQRITEYQLSTASLEDVYFSIVGERLSNEEREK